jgi:hypothetical protein
MCIQKWAKRRNYLKSTLRTLLKFLLTYFLDGSFNNARHSTKEKKKRKKKRLLIGRYYLHMEDGKLGLLYTRSQGPKNLGPTLSILGLQIGPQVTNKC